MSRRPGFALTLFCAWLAVTLVWWALAFAPLPAPASWLARVRAVCFGTLPDGLPDTWGWGGLIVSPLAMLGLLLAVWGSDLARELRRLGRSGAGRIALAILFGVPFAGAAWVAARVVEARQMRFDIASPALGALPAHYPRGLAPAPPLGLVDQRGERVDVADLEGRPVLVTFAFAHCRTVCPVVVRTVRQAASLVPDEGPAVVVVSLDPWRDTPSSLPSLLAAWELTDLPAHVLSGEVDVVLGVLAAWNMPIQRDPQTGDIAHPALVAVLDREGRLAYTFHNPPVPWVVEAVRRLG